MQNKYLLEQSSHFCSGRFQINLLTNITKMILIFFQIFNILVQERNYRENKDKDIRYQKRFKKVYVENEFSFGHIVKSIYIYISILKKESPPKDRFSSSRVIQFRSTIDSR